MSFFGTKKNSRPQLESSKFGFVNQPNIYLSFHIAPLLRSTQVIHQIIEQTGVLRSKFKPGEKIKRLTDVPAVIELTGNLRKVFQTQLGVVRFGFKDLSALILGQVPPRLTFFDGDEGAICGLCAAQSGLYLI